MSIFLSLAFTEILHLKNILGLWFLHILKWNNMLFEKLHLLVCGNDCFFILLNRISSTTKLLGHTAMYRGKLLYFEVQDCFFYHLKYNNECIALMISKSWYSFSWHLQMARQMCLPTVVSGSIPGSIAHLLLLMTESCRCVIQCCLRARRRLMLCTVDYEICKSFAIWRWGSLLLKYSTIFFSHSFTDWRASAHLYFWETLPLFYSQSCYRPDVNWLN